jgi:hypothetical protein
MRAIKQHIRTWDDVNNFYPKLLRLASREAPEGEKPNVSRIIRRAIRAELERCGMIRKRKPKVKLPLVYQAENTETGGEL